MIDTPIIPNPSQSTIQSDQSEFPKFRMFLFHSIPKEAAASIRAPARSSQELTSPRVG